MRNFIPMCLRKKNPRKQFNESVISSDFRSEIDDEIGLFLKSEAIG